MLRILQSRHPALRVTCGAFDFDAPPTHPIKLARAMAGAMLRAKGLGLAAPQVGRAERVFVMRRGTMWIACFNPEILSADGRVADNEGCLSDPGTFIRIVRPATLLARWQDETGAARGGAFKDLAARCFAHELDHLNGLTLRAMAGG